MAINAGEPFVNDAAQSKVLRIPLSNAAGTVTIDTANMHPSLANKVEIVASAIAGTLLTEQTYTGANGTTAFGIGLLDGLAVGPVSGWCLVGATSGSMVAGTVGTVAGISGQGTPGITTSKNVAVLVTLPATAAAGTGKVEVFLEIR